jgi:hypothetical protein
MTKSVEVGLYTVPSTWVRPNLDKLSTPYRRVVGTEYGDGVRSLSWAKIDPSQPETSYRQEDTSLEVINIPNITAERLIGFFQRFYSDTPRSKSNYDLRTGQYMGERTESYNCHKFGYWMSGTPAAQKFECPEAPDYVTERRPIDTPLPIGRHGVIGIVGAAVHSIVGLGEDREDCLQVISMGGHMGIDTYQAVIDSYETKDLQFFA